MAAAADGSWIQSMAMSPVNMTLLFQSREAAQLLGRYLARQTKCSNLSAAVANEVRLQIPS